MQERRPDLRVRQPNFGAGRVYDAYTLRLAETTDAMKVPPDSSRVQ
jgi:hypothetical protein